MTTADVSGPSAAASTAAAATAAAVVSPNSPPTKASLANWWERFKKKSARDDEKGTAILVHCRPLVTTPLDGIAVLYFRAVLLTPASRAPGHLWRSIESEHTLRKRRDFIDRPEWKAIHLRLCAYCGG